MDNKIKEALDSFVKTIIVPNDMKCLLVGSLALNMLGMELGEPHDIDMEVILKNPEQESILKTLSEASGNDFYKKKCESYECAENRMENVTWEHKPYIFTWKGVEINVWVVSEFSHNFITLQNEINVATVMSVVRKKVAYNRKKDIRFCSKMAKKFLSLTEI